MPLTALHLFGMTLSQEALANLIENLPALQILNLTKGIGFSVVKVKSEVIEFCLIQLVN